MPAFFDPGLGEMQPLRSLDDTQTPYGTPILDKTNQLHI